MLDFSFSFLLAGSSILQIFPTGSRNFIFDRIFFIFVLLGTIVGVIVIAYMLIQAYRYREGSAPKKDDVDRPKLGELPPPIDDGNKLLKSLLLSAVVVIALVVWTYGSLLYVEAQPSQVDGALTVEVEAYQFGFLFTYPDGYQSTGVLRAPVDRVTVLKITSRDVLHNFGSPDLRIKADAAPGQVSETWFLAESTGTYDSACYELCGAGHSYMKADIIILENSEFEQWNKTKNKGS